ncbi:M20/M25/M40 family metallo-hydrolase [Candidatus Bathyarchaeota archaeon]|nr:M20/M25/M40 family metallo-hydrolase [Candidatus Bathyarchaeota archaeon]
MDEASVYKAVDEKRDESIGYLRELVQMYPLGEEELQRRIADRFQNIGCQVQSIKLLPTTVQLSKEFAVDEAIDMTERTHVIGRLPGSGGGRSLMLITHPDADPVNAEGWTREPHEGETEDGRMFGWAVADDLAGIGIITGAVEALAAAGVRPKGDVYLMSASAKRNAWGIAALLREGYSADAALYVHPAESELGLKEIKTLTSGLLKFRLKVKGRNPPNKEFVQVTFHHLGVNPIEKAVYLIEGLKRLDEERRKKVRYKPLEDSVGRSTNLLVTYIEAGKNDNLTDLPLECTVGVGLTFPLQRT